ncbi:hypothetical protein CTA1_6158 [Colletotrichum tanaceti]|uniref:Uncharacterized protein n=1 Tax=Colletotrichum tanaceti TaxID=1306861 RepID=A0A4U6X6K5_9PEZI|nr:hypothetical protein CTA1_6158 [Colletotrichum tanaceti]
MASHERRSANDRQLDGGNTATESEPLKRLVKTDGDEEDDKSRARGDRDGHADEDAVEEDAALEEEALAEKLGPLLFRDDLRQARTRARARRHDDLGSAAGRASSAWSVSGNGVQFIDVEVNVGGVVVVEAVAVSCETVSGLGLRRRRGGQGRGAGHQALGGLHIIEADVLGPVGTVPVRGHAPRRYSYSCECEWEWPAPRVAR